MDIRAAEDNMPERLPAGLITGRESWLS